MNLLSRILGLGQNAGATQEAETDEPWGFQTLHEDTDPLFE